MGDADSGDVLTPVKVSGPSFATISKVNNTTGRWTVNTDHASSVQGAFNLDYRVDDDWGGRSVTRTFQVNILAGNQPPVLVRIKKELVNGLLRQPGKMPGGPIIQA